MKRKMNIFRELSWRFNHEGDGGAGSNGAGAGGEGGDPEGDNPGGKKSDGIDPKAFTDLQGENDRLKAKVDELLTETKETKRLRREAEEKARKEAEELARKSGDIEALEASWNEKYNAKVTELTSKYEDENGTLRSLLHNATVESTANAIAAEIATPGNSKILLPHLRTRLALDIKDGKSRVVVRGADGKPSALTMDELKQEFINDPAFAPVILGSKASGGGANGANGGAGGEKTMVRSKFDSLPDADRIKFVKDGGKVIDKT